MNLIQCAIFLTIDILVTVLVKKLWTTNLYPELPEGYEEKDILLVCNFRTWLACASLVGGIFVGGLMFLGMCMNLISGQGDIGEVLAAVVLMAGVLFCFEFFIYTMMKNYAVVFLTDGVLYREMNGKVHFYRDAEVTNFSQTHNGKYSRILIETDTGSVNLSCNATNYYNGAIEICEKYRQHEHAGA